MSLIDDAFAVAHGLSLDDEVLIYRTVTDPTSGAGTAAPVGSLLLQKPASGEGQLWKKYDTGDTDWKKFASKAYESSSDPTANNDSVDTASIGITFNRGDVWVNTTDDSVFLCGDDTATLAVWHEIVTDEHAIHDNVSGEINAISEKISPVDSDLFLIEDSAASNAKKKVKLEKISLNIGGYKELSISQSPHQNGVVRLLGWHIQTDTAESITSAAPYTSADKCFHSHAVVDISSAVGLPFTLRITGTSVNETTGATTGSDTEDIDVDANGYYQSTKSWIDEPEFSIVEASKSCTVDVYRTTYWDKGNVDFNIRGSRVEWQPNQASWTFNYYLYKINNDGSKTVIDSFEYSQASSPARAANGEPGKYKRLDYDETIGGANMEGIHLQIDQSGIKNFYIEVKFG